MREKGKEGEGEGVDRGKGAPRSATHYALSRARLMIMR